MLAAALPALLGYARFVEPYWLRVIEQPLILSDLPAAAEGRRVVQLSDLHLGPWISPEYLNRAVTLANSLEPDLMVLTGDYVRKDPRYIAPVYEILSQLQAPLGVYGVFGNHDQWEDPDLSRSREAMADAGIVNLTDRAARLTGDGQGLWLVGVGDLWTGRPDLDKALAPLPPDAPVMLLSHNPDFAEQVHDPRVRLVLAGHTHGGQVRLPLLGARVVPSNHGQKYSAGLVATGGRLVYVNRGVGMAVLPVRLGCRPEVTVLTLHGGP